ncbi:unnamed protein product [Candidula unifasciata]|uniref:F-box domain-containing protein n=1 Tax=Candidula unifasciata TaxID=100452 RepID=A0A8S3ZWZ8_9EUPU|nr:unnamed protein product [Candidula unifasciata]
MQRLPLPDRCRAKRVCKMWNRILCDDSLWRHVDLTEYHLDLKAMWKLVRYSFLPCLLTLKIWGYAFADDGSEEKPSVSKALLRGLSTRCPNLQLLHLFEHKTSSISFEHLPASITCLEMVNNKWWPRWLKDKQMHLPKLEHLNLDESEHVSDLDLEDIAMFKNLKYLSLYRCCNIGSTGVTTIAENLSELEVLNIGHASVDDLAVYYIALHLKKLKELFLEKCRKLTDIALFSIAEGLLVLDTLDISFCEEITIIGLEFLIDTNLSLLIAKHAWYRYSEEDIQKFKRGFSEDFTLVSFKNRN